MASSDPYVSYTQNNPDFQAFKGIATSKPPSGDVFVPFPRTSGVHISPSGLMVAFGLHQPIVDIVQAVIPIPLGISRTPRSFHDYLQLTEGKEHLFCTTPDSFSVRQQQTRISKTGDQADINGQLKRSISAEAIYGDGVRDGVQNTSSASLVSFESPKNALRRRHFSGKTSEESRQVNSQLWCLFDCKGLDCGKFSVYLLGFRHSVAFRIGRVQVNKPDCYIKGRKYKGLPTPFGPRHSMPPCPSAGSLLITIGLPVRLDCLCY